MFRLLPRLVLFELIKITMLSFCALVLLIVIGGAMIEASKRGLDPIKIMALMPFLIPPTLPFVLPMSFLLRSRLCTAEWLPTRNWWRCVRAEFISSA